MNPRNAPWQSYRNVSTFTAPPEQLVLMLYDGAIKFMECSLTAFDFKDPLQFNQNINNNVQRAQDIVNELNSRLDMDKGGEAATNFRALYSYFYRRLQEGNLKKKKAPIEEVLKHVRVMRDSWAEMLRRGPEASAEEPAPEPFPDADLRFA